MIDPPSAWMAGGEARAVPEPPERFVAETAATAPVDAPLAEAVTRADAAPFPLIAAMTWAADDVPSEIVGVPVQAPVGVHPDDGGQGADPVIQAEINAPSVYCLRLHVETAPKAATDFTEYQSPDSAKEADPSDVQIASGLPSTAYNSGKTTGSVPSVSVPETIILAFEPGVTVIASETTDTSVVSWVADDRISTVISFPAAPASTAVSAMELSAPAGSSVTEAATDSVPPSVVGAGGASGVSPPPVP